VLVLSPLVHFGSAQADLVVAARSCAIPVGMLLFSWDNLSTKGALHQAPDWIFVWNEQQREEAAAIHGFPRDRVVVAGAPRFDRFFTLQPQLTRSGFHEPLGLDPAQPTLLYVCSSQFVSSAEMAFVRKWIAALRAADSSAVRRCNVIVRPHPDVRLSDPAVATEELRWPELRGLKGIVTRPFGDQQAIVLRTSDRLQQGLYESIAHSAAVVGLNTSAELEAAIVGKPVYTVLAGPADADGQSSTLHFHYLVEGHGGCVRVANGLEQHIVQIDAELRTPSAPEPLRQFVHRFLRPQGIERPVAPLLAEAIESTFASTTPIPMPMVAESASTPAGTATHRRNESDGATVTVTVATAAVPSVVVPVTFSRLLYSVDIYAGGDAQAHKFDRMVVEWLREHVKVGDVLYDVDAGIGLYTLLAVKHRGATVIAFEPGFTAFKRLADNVLLNRADGAVTALPLAVADFDGLGYLKYPPGQAGSERHSLRRAGGVPAGRRAAGEDRAFEQSICTVSLDRALTQYGLPQPAHLRLGARSQAAAILSGAAGLLSSTSLRTIFLTTTEANREPVRAALAAAGWSVSDLDPLAQGRSHVIASRLLQTSTI
jgi:FkbM family methyltransferase